MEVLSHAIIAQDIARLEVGRSAFGWSLRARFATALVLIVAVDSDDTL